MKPTISIVTINYNNRIGLQKTIDSVLLQSDKPFEFIVIDGASTEGSQAVIDKNKDNISYWISEKDEGIYDAQNKGLAQVTGNYVLFLNSGDQLANKNVLSEVLPFLTGIDIVYGDLIIKEESKEWVKKYNEPMSFGYFLGDTLPHQGSFIKRTVFEKTGNFDKSLKICADWKFFIEAICRYNVSFKYIGIPIAVYDYSGVSSNPENKQKMDLEKQAVLRSSFPMFKDEYQEFFKLRSEYPLLANSRVVKTYFKIRNLFVRHK